MPLDLRPAQPASRGFHPNCNQPVLPESRADVAPWYWEKETPQERAIINDLCEKYNKDPICPHARWLAAASRKKRKWG
jgi:hypothetical protein